MSRTYTLTLTEAQAGTLQVACEVLARLGIGQFRDALEHLPLSEHFPPGWHDDMRLIESVMEKHIRPNSRGIMTRGTKLESQRAWDLYQVIRYRLAWDRAIANGVVQPGAPRNWPEMMQVSYDDPMNTAGEPLAKIEAGDSP